MDNLLRWLIGIKNTQVTKNQTLLETTQYGGFAFWWFLRHKLYRDLLMAFEEPSRTYRRSWKKYVFTKLNFLFYFYLLFLILISKLVFHVARSRSNDSVLFTNNFTAWRMTRDPVTGILSQGHTIFNPIIRKIRISDPGYVIKSSYTFGLSLHRHLKSALKMKQSKRIDSLKPIESWFNWRIFLKYVKAKGSLTKKWSQIKSTKNDGKLIFQNIDIFLTFCDLFEYYYKIYVPLMILYYELSIQLLRQDKPNLVLLSNESEGFERALLYASTSLGIATLAVQHGIIHSIHPGYIYGPEEASRDGIGIFPFVPLPTKTCVYGPYYKDILTKSSAYPESAVVVTGQPRYDILNSASKFYSRTRFCKRYGLDSDKPIALLSTQPFSREFLRTEFFLTTVKTLQEFKDVQIVVKPHPNEDSRWHKQKLQGVNASALVLSPTSDTHEAIFSCDLFFAVNSTTILEALILNKPVIAVNISNQPEVLPWVKEHAVFGVYNANELLSTIKMALSDQERLQKMISKRTQFLNKHLFNLDGKATDRVVSLFHELVGGKKG